MDDPDPILDHCNGVWQVTYKKSNYYAGGVIPVVYETTECEGGGDF